MNANAAWISMLRDVAASPLESSPRGMRIKEVLGRQSRIDMSSPIVTVKERKLSRKFMFAEAHWILSGDNRVETIAPYNKNIAKFSDDGRFFFGAYGPRVVDQLSYVVDCLVKDRDSRQAVMTIWRPNPRPTKDVPCTVSAQLLIRQGKIHCVDSMRSSDGWLGWPYDVFNFTMLSAYVGLMVRERTGEDLKLGTLTLNVGSQHLYESNWEAVERVLENPDGPGSWILDLADFEEADELLDCLSEAKDGAPFLNEVAAMS